METEKLTQLIADVVSNKDIRERGNAACQIIATKDVSAFQQMLDALQKLPADQYDLNVLDLTIDVLIDNISIFLPILVNYCQQQPNTQVGKSCIYLLGELAYKQCLYKKSVLPNTDILVALIALLEHRATLDRETLSTVITAIKSYAYYGDIITAQSVLEDLLSSCSNSSTPPKWSYASLSEAIEVLSRIYKSDKITELQAQLAQSTTSGWFATQLQAELQGS